MAQSFAIAKYASHTVSASIGMTGTVKQVFAAGKSNSIAGAVSDTYTINQMITRHKPVGAFGHHSITAAIH
jgi:hypothetical protein